MTGSSITKEELSKLATILAGMGIAPELATRGQICKALGCNDRRARTLQGHMRPEKTGGGSPPSKSESETNEFVGNEWIISLPKTSIRTLDELLAHCKADLTIWEVERFVVNKWEVGAKDNAGKVDVTPLFQVKAWFKRKAAVTAAKAELEALKEAAKKAAPWVKPAANKTGKGYALEISIPDLHVGKMAWANETGWEHYDVKIAQKVFKDALYALLERTQGYQFDEIVFVVGNDLLHTDNEKGTTTAGTPLGGEGVDGRYHKTFVKVREMMTDAIEMLRTIAPVKVIIVPGNHDTLSTWHLGDSLECRFANYADVAIDNDPRMRKYYQFGKVMLMMTHGNKGKLADYPLVMATEQPKMFGETIHREAHTGDKHQLKVQELHGVRVRISPALCAPDVWHSEHQFVGNARAAEAFVWHKDEGLIASATYTVPNAKQAA